MSAISVPAPAQSRSFSMKWPRVIAFVLLLVLLIVGGFAAGFIPRWKQEHAVEQQAKVSSDAAPTSGQSRPQLASRQTRSEYSQGTAYR